MNPKNIVEKIILVFLSFYFLALYELVITPAVMEWSFFGILLSLIIVGLLSFSIPSDKRISYLIYALAFLAINRALGNLKNASIILNVVGSVIVFFVIFFISKYFGRVSFGSFIVVFLTALFINITFYPFEYPLWSKFIVKWRSPVLYDSNSTIDYFPLQVANVDGKGGKEIIVQGNFDRTKKSTKDEGLDGEDFPFQKNEESTYLVFSWNGKTFDELKQGEYSISEVAKSLKNDYLNFPYYGVKYNLSSNGIIKNLTPLRKPEVLIENAMVFGQAPFSAISLDLESIMQYEEAEKSLEKNIAHNSGKSLGTNIRLDNPMQISAQIKDSLLTGEYKGKPFSIQTGGSAILGTAHCFSDDSAQLIVLGRDLYVYSVNIKGEIRLISQLSTKKVPDIGTADLVIGDVDLDGKDELMLNTEYARILKLGEQGEWKVLWLSPDNSFRFESYTRIGEMNRSEIFALSNSFMRQNKTKYVTDYKFSPSGLEQQWRIFMGLTELTPGDVDGDGQIELISYLPYKHVIFVLEKSKIPLVPLVYTFTICLILLGFYGKLGKAKLRRFKGDS